MDRINMLVEEVAKLGALVAQQTASTAALDAHVSKLDRTVSTMDETIRGNGKNGGLVQIVAGLADAIQRINDQSNRHSDMRQRVALLVAGATIGLVAKFIGEWMGF